MKNKGITLIALVITIIVLLILAGITIVSLYGENGILRNSTTASIEHAHGQVYEALTVEQSNYLIDKVVDEKGETLLAELRKKGIIDENNIVNSVALLGSTLPTGKGSGTTDVYKIEETEKENQYDVNYYDSQGTKRRLGPLSDTGVKTGSVVNPTPTPGTDPNKIIEDFKTYPENYTKPDDQTETDDVGLAEDGTVLNMDFWNYEINDDDGSFALVR